MYDWDINVAKARGFGSAAGMEKGWDGKPVYSHHFRITKPDGHTNEEQARSLYAEIAEAYPAPGYHVTLTRWSRPLGMPMADNMEQAEA